MAHPSVEKTVRVLCDYYRKVTSDLPGAEAELFWRNRRNVKRASRMEQSFEANIPGVPGNYFMAGHSHKHTSNPAGGAAAN